MPTKTAPAKKTRAPDLKVRDAASLDEPALRDFVDQAVRLDEERGDPTRRS
ncbi:MAG: hypothetical protein M3Y87_18860 [Myxococcota bacterium]|nr:hypothetical protein [Myxococcota bacterium]